MHHNKSIMDTIDAIRKAFDDAKNNDPINGINEEFAIYWIVSLGADPNYNGDLPFKLLLTDSNGDIVSMFINEYNITDVNCCCNPTTTSNVIFEIACKQRKWAHGILKILLENGLIPNDQIVTKCINNLDDIKLLLNYGIDIEVLFNAYSVGFGNSYEINKYFLDKIKEMPFLFVPTKCLTKILLALFRSLSAEEIKFLIDKGAYIGDKMDYLFELSCYHQDYQNLIFYLINEHGFNINGFDIIGKIIEYHGIDINIIRYLLDLGSLKIYVNVCVRIRLQYFYEAFIAER